MQRVIDAEASVYTPAAGGKYSGLTRKVTPGSSFVLGEDSFT
ncbi:MAG: hypothetical protein ABIT96_10180 [Ferruginibacter sp.]